jgi:beta-lactamase regulating signal transducer with metallopeptidase domain/HEAT repeat protein
MKMQMIGWALLHSIWQVALIAGISAILLAAARRASPATRYWIGLVGLALMFALPIATAMRLSPAPSESAAFVATGRADVETDAPPAEASQAPSPAAGQPVAAPGGAGLRVPGAWIDASVIRTAETFIPWIVAAWFIGLVLASVRLLGGIARTRRLTRHGVTAASRAIEDSVVRLSGKLGLDRAIRALESVNTEVPLVIGALRPVIVIPVSLVTGLTPMQLDMLLAHELAHVRRHDFAINLVQTVVETLLFYHPAARWLSSRVREERENCCDDMAVAVCGGNAREYTAALLALEESRSPFGFAAAANGGSLLRRARRLLSVQPSHREIGPRWIAGIVTIAAALLTGREAVGLGVQSSFTPATFVESLDRMEDSTRKERRGAADPRKAQPLSVVKSAAGGSLESQWRWAEQQGTRAGGSYWIGFLVAGDAVQDRTLYMDDELPVYISDGVVTTGRMMFRASDQTDLTFQGTRLSPIIGQHAPHSMVYFFLVDNRLGGRRIARVHAAQAPLPMHFDSKPLIWLDSASDAESIALLRELLGNARSDDLRESFVTAIGAHTSANLVVPVLTQILQSRAYASSVRRVAAEWLAYQGTDEAVMVLSRAIRSDPSNDVRQEAIDSFSQTSYRGATDSLIAFASSLPLFDQRKTAIEALGNRHDRKAVDYLTMVATSRLDTNLPEHAVEALGSMPDGIGEESVIRLAKSSPSSQVRQNAAESIGHFVRPDRAIPILREMLRTDPDESVRYRAAESIAYAKGGEAVLEGIILGDESDELRITALRGYLDQVKNARAVAMLQRVIKSDRSPDVRARAQELLDDR